MPNTIFQLSLLIMFLAVVLTRFVWLKNLSNVAFEKVHRRISPLVVGQASKDCHPFLVPELCPKNVLG